MTLRQIILDPSIDFPQKYIFKLVIRIEIFGIEPVNVFRNDPSCEQDGYQMLYPNVRRNVRFKSYKYDMLIKSFDFTWQIFSLNEQERMI